MISLAVFCPFERIAAQIAKLAGSAKRLDLDFGAYGTRTYYPELGIDQNLGFSETARAAFMNQSEVECKVSVVYDEASAKESKVIVRHALLTSSPARLPTKVKGRLMKNGSIGSMPVWYPEAYYTTTFSDIGASEHVEVSVSHLRPWYNYLGRYDGMFYIWGPAVSKMDVHPSVGVYTSDLASDLLFDGSSTYVVEPMVEVESPTTGLAVESSEIVKTGHVVLEFTDGTGETKQEPLVFGQRCVGALGSRVSPEVGYYGLLLDAVLDLDPTQVFVLKLVEARDGLALSAESRVAAQKLLDTTTLGAELMSRFDFSRNDVLVVKDRALGSVLRYDIAKGSNEACFALSLCTLLASGSKTPRLTRLFLLLACLDQGYLVINNGEVHGATGRLTGQVVALEYREGLEKKSGFFCRRIVLKTDPLELGRWYLLGLEYNDLNNEPDHWVVVRYDGERLRLVFDPYLSDQRKFGSDMTGEREIAGSMLLEFVSDFPNLGGQLERNPQHAMA